MTGNNQAGGPTLAVGDESRINFHMFKIDGNGYSPAHGPLKMIHSPVAAAFGASSITGPINCPW